MEHPTRILGALLCAAVVTLAAPSHPATLPPHSPLRILVVSDEVNPHGLSAAELTQPGDISTALLEPGSGLTLDPAPDGVREIATDDLADATALLARDIDAADAYDVVVYFAHRIPGGGSGAQDQADFVAALDAFLVAGGGLVSFHHGSYETAGKSAVQALIGATATASVPWNTVDGQNVINVAPGHFVTTHEVEYPGSVTYADVARGIPSASYPFFNNTPDERYTTFEVNASAGTFSVLFGSDYDQNGTSHLLGFEHRRPEWAGVVIGYQPGEYQPNALDDLEGNNFQILANAIYFAAYRPDPPVPAFGSEAAVVAIGAMLLVGALTLRRQVDPSRRPNAKPPPRRSATGAQYVVRASDATEAG